jgi:hypothetical protein
LLAKHVQPFIDFDHEGKASAANPKGFRWVTGKGVYLALEWTKGGRERVEGKTTDTSLRPSTWALTASLTAFQRAAQSAPSRTTRLSAIFSE